MVLLTAAILYLVEPELSPSTWCDTRHRAYVSHTVLYYSSSSFHRQGYDVRLLYWPQTKEKVIQYLTQTNASSSSSSQPQVDEPLQHHAVVDVDNMLHQSGLFSSNDNSASRVYISSLVCWERLYCGLFLKKDTALISSGNSILRLGWVDLAEPSELFKGANTASDLLPNGREGVRIEGRK